MNSMHIFLTLRMRPDFSGDLDQHRRLDQRRDVSCALVEGLDLGPASHLADRVVHRHPRGPHVKIQARTFLAQLDQPQMLRIMPALC